MIYTFEKRCFFALLPRTLRTQRKYYFQNKLQLVTMHCALGSRFGFVANQMIRLFLPRTTSELPAKQIRERCLVNTRSSVLKIAIR